MIDTTRELYRRVQYYLHRDRFDRALDEELTTIVFRINSHRSQTCRWATCWPN